LGGNGRKHFKGVPQRVWSFKVGKDALTYTEPRLVLPRIDHGGKIFSNKQLKEEKERILHTREKKNRGALKKAL